MAEQPPSLTLEQENKLLKDLIKQLCLSHTTDQWMVVHAKLKAMGIIEPGTKPKVKLK